MPNATAITASRKPDARPRRLGSGVAGAIVAAIPLALALAGCARLGNGADALPPLAPDEAVVVRIVDGDTIRVRRTGGIEESIRLIGVDTPESVRPGTPVQCFAKEAAAHLRSLLPRRTIVRLERDVELRDRYGRLLAYVFRRPDDLFVNQELAAQGFARLSTHPPNVAYVDRFVAAVADARQHERGLWSRCGRTTVPP